MISVDDTREKRMVSRMDTNWVPVTLPPPKAVKAQKGMVAERPADRKQDVVVLENRKEIRPHTRFEKGMFIDLYA